MRRIVTWKFVFLSLIVILLDLTSKARNGSTESLMVSRTVSYHISYNTRRILMAFGTSDKG